MLLSRLMFHITIIAVGKLKDKQFSVVCADYIKRINTFAKIEIIEVESSPSFSDGDIQRVQREEEERIKRVLEKKKGDVVLLSEDGKQYSSSDLAKFIVGKKNEIIFVIGGSFGFTESFKHSHTTHSLSLLTFPHELARVILVEQLYRAITINQKQNKYNK